MLHVELVYRAEDGQLFQKHVEVVQGCTVMQVLQMSGLHQQFPETKQLSVGIFSIPASMDQVVRDGDRLEVYRPLLIDPMEKRRRRAKSR